LPVSPIELATALGLVVIVLLVVWLVGGFAGPHQP